MTIRISRDPIYRRRRFPAETIELCVRWYITYRLSYRDLAAIMAEREIAVSHTTVMRWVLRYVPEYERRWARFARSPGSSWRMDETAVNVRGGRHYLYRAVDRDGKSVASLLCRDRSMWSAQAFFRSAVGKEGVRWSGKINLDGNKATHRGLRLLAKEDYRWRAVEIRARRYLNNVVEQDHRAIKQRCASMLGLKSFRSAAITLAGVELAHRIRKGQHLLPLDHGGRASSLKNLWDRALGTSMEASIELKSASGKKMTIMKYEPNGGIVGCRGKTFPANQEVSVDWSNAGVIRISISVVSAISKINDTVDGLHVTYDIGTVISRDCGFART